MKRWACLLALLCLLPTVAGASSFTIADYAMDVVVEPDGAGLFTETIAYAFGGDYNGFLMTIRHEGVGFSDLAIYEGGRAFTRVDALDGEPLTYTAETRGNQTDIRAYAPGAGDTRVFTVAYRMDGLALRYRDAARVNQLLLRAETGYRNAVFTLTLPGTDTESVRPFGHGALYGEAIGMRDGKLTFGPVAVREGEFVEVQVLFPARWIDGAALIDTDIEASALAVERRIADEMEREAARGRALALSATVGLGVYALVFLSCFYRARAKYGLTARVASVTDGAMLSGIPAAMAQALRGRGVSSSGLSATLMELTGRGVLSMRADADDTCFALTGDAGGLLPHQRHLIGWLFPQGGELWIGSLDMGKDYRAAQAFTNEYNRFKALVASDVRDAGWAFRNGGARVGLSLCALLLGLLLAAALAVFAQSALLAALGAVLGVLFCVLFARLRRLTDDGERHLAAINGFLENYADRLGTDPRSVLGHVPLLMALGYLEPMAEWIDAHRDDGYDRYWDGSPAWMYAGWHHGVCRMDRAVRDAQHHNASVQDPNASSGSGGGGGSSGGSGGGSSHGAW